MIDNLVALLNIKSPTGHTQAAITFVQQQLEALNIPFYTTNKGALVATLQGRDTSKSVVLSAHVDTLGCLVKEITSEGYLKLSQIGGFAWNTIEGEYVSIETSLGKFYRGTVLTDVASSHVFGSKTNSNERNEHSLRVRIDEKITSQADVLALGIAVGDYVHLDPRTEVTDSGFIKSRHLDDKACVMALLEVARRIVVSQQKPQFITHLFFSNYEEVGHGASSGIPKDAFEMVALDMSAPGKGQTSSEFKVTICAKDSTGPYDYELKNRLVNLAQHHNIPYTVDIYPYYGSDGSAALRAGYDLKVGLIGPGVDASHSFERTHMEAIEHTIALTHAYLDVK